MRVIAGEYRGRPLNAPKGTDTRPTTDRVKESMMSALGNARGGFEGARVLDAFAGSGALGIEALSRGASSVEFYEKDRRALEALNKNIIQLRIEEGKARVNKSDVLLQAPRKRGKQFDVVFLDPPYRMKAEAVADFLLKLHEEQVLEQEVLIVYEYASADKHNSGLDELLSAQKIFSKTYGDTGVDIFSWSSYEPVVE